MSKIRKALGLLVAFVALASHAAPAAAQNPNLFPRYQPRPQTDAERLNTFRVPPAPRPTYPTISGGDRGDPRLYINRDVSVGGSLGRGSAEGNVRFPIPGTR